MRIENNIRLDVEQLAKDILEELDTKDFQHNPAWDIARKQIEEMTNPAVFKILNQTLETQALALEGMFVSVRDCERCNNCETAVSTCEVIIQGNAINAALQQAADHLRSQKITKDI